MKVPARLRLAGFLGLALLAAALATPHAAQAWGALCASWLFASGAALGLVALLAATRIVQGRWIEPLADTCRRGVLFLPWSFAVLLLLIAAGPKWIPWLRGPGMLEEWRRWWFNLPAFALREIVGTAVLFALAARVVDVPRWGRRAMIWSIAYLIAFASVLTLWALDFILALDREWVSPLVGAFYFMGSLLAATALAAIIAASQRHGPGLRHDVGKLLFGLSVFWAYLLWAQLLTQWYGNLPEEIEFWIVRQRNPWHPLGLASIALVFGLPFFILMRETAKREGWILRASAAGILLGIWLGLQTLIAPSFSPSLAGATVLAAAGSTLSLLALLAAGLKSSTQLTPT
jgi:hypothetical protein